MKGKSEYVVPGEQLVKGDNRNGKLEFVYYDMVDKGIDGYYPKITGIKERVIVLGCD